MMLPTTITRESPNDDGRDGDDMITMTSYRNTHKNHDIVFVFIKFLAVVLAILATVAIFPTTATTARSNNNGFWSLAKQPSQTIANADYNTVDAFSMPNTAPKPFNVSDLHLLAFGTSRTYGKGLLHPETESFMNLLSPHVLNLAVPGGDVDYASLCLSTLLENRTFHAILVESKAGEHLLPFLHRLLLRLRRRFPHAPIIFVGNKPPARYVHLPTNMTLYPWMQSQGLEERNDTLLMERLQAHSTAEDWQVEEELYKEQRQMVLSSTSNVHYFPYPPQWYPEDSLQFFRHGLQYFYDHEMPEHTFRHFSVLGHRTIAERVRDILTELHEQQQQQQSTDNNDLPPIDPITWWNRTAPKQMDGTEDDDYCDSWFQRGTLVNNKKSKSTMSVQTNMKMAQIKADGTGGKWALEVPSDHGGGYLTITNPSPREVDVYVDHMKLHPERDQYPLTRATLGSNNNGNNTTTTFVDLDPRFSFDMPFPVHITWTSYVGKIGAGVTTNITFTPLETGMAHPFHVTGYVVTPTNEQLEEIQPQQQHQPQDGL